MLVQVCDRESEAVCTTAFVFSFLEILQNDLFGNLINWTFSKQPCSAILPQKFCRKNGPKSVYNGQERVFSTKKNDLDCKVSQEWSKINQLKDLTQQRMHWSVPSEARWWLALLCKSQIVFDEGLGQQRDRSMSGLFDDHVRKI